MNSLVMALVPAVQFIPSASPGGPPRLPDRDTGDGQYGGLIVILILIIAHESSCTQTMPVRKSVAAGGCKTSSLRRLKSKTADFLLS